MNAIPKPPPRMLDTLYGEFAPAMDLEEWARETFIEEDAALVNSDHEHLRAAQLLFLWYSDAFKRHGRVIVATAQLGAQQGSLGKKELLEQRFREWNGGNLPDFVCTFSAPWFHECSALSACAVTEHELYHCAQALDGFGDPKFTLSGFPVWAMRGHDVECFVGEAARYGPHSPELVALKNVLDQGPVIRQSDIDVACGCGARIG